MNKITISDFGIFKKEYKKGKFNGQRFGQAFYNHYSIHKMAAKEALNIIYDELDAIKVLELIHLHFNIEN